ncbi:MAG: TOBE domain-containing protein, partial [Thermomicrobiales bacterium]
VELDELTLIGPGGWRLPAQDHVSRLPAKITAGLRPEAIILSQTASDEPDAHAGQVFITEPLGSEVIVNVRIDDRMLKVRVDPSVRPQPGDTVWLRPAPGGLRLFDQETGLAL